MPFPQLRSATGVESDNATVGGAADMTGTAGGSNFVRGDRDEQPVVVIADGAGNDGGVEQACGVLPDNLQTVGINREYGCHRVGEYEQIPAIWQCQRGNRRAYSAEHFSIGTDAPGGPVQGV